MENNTLPNLECYIGIPLILRRGEILAFPAIASIWLSIWFILVQVTQTWIMSNLMSSLIELHEIKLQIADDEHKK